MALHHRLAQSRNKEQSIASLLSGGVVFTFLWATLLAIGVGGILGIFFARFYATWQSAKMYQAIIQEVSEPLYNQAFDEVSRTASSFTRNEEIRTLRITSADKSFVYTLQREQPLYPVSYSDAILYQNTAVGTIEYIAENNYLKNYGYILVWVILFIVFINFISLLLTTRYLFRNFLQKPMQQVLGVVHNYNQGNYAITSPVIQYTEFKPILTTVTNLGETITRQMRELRTAEEKYRAMFEYGVIGIFQSTPEGRFINMNPELAKMLGYNTPQEAIQFITNIADQVYGTPRDRSNLVQKLQQTDQVINTVVNLKRKDGENWVANLSMRSVKNKNGEITFLEGFVADFTEHQRVLNELTQYRLYLEELVKKRTEAISQQNMELQREIAERKQVEEALRGSEERYRLLAENASDVIWTIDLKGNMTYVSPAVTQLRGYTPEEIMNKSINDNLTAPSARIVQRKMNQYLRLEGKDIPDTIAEVLELELTCKNRSTIWTETMISRLSDNNGTFIGLLGVTRDISEKKKAREKLRKLAITDALTGIHNRGHFYELANLELQRARRYHRELSVILLDIDGFKLINDSYGHFAGDEVLRALTRQCKLVLRENDIFARFGGDEFVILLPETSSEESMAVASRLQQGMETLKIVHEEDTIQITISLGTTSLADKNTEKLDHLLILADQALYMAKEKGRNQVVFLPNRS